jgi:CBS domain-containing protein
MAIVREATIKFEGSFEPRAVLVFDEKYQLMGILTLRDIIRGLEPRFLQETSLLEMDANLTVLMDDLLGPNIKEASQRPVSEVMSPIQITVDGNSPFVKALSLMVKENVGLMPVMLDNRVAGMIRLSDLFAEIANAVLSD